MNTPRSKPPKRFTNQRPRKIGRTPEPDGEYKNGLFNDDYLNLVGKIITYLPNLEERMIEFMALLMGGDQAPARQVFRSLNSEDAKLKILTSLLEDSPLNKNKGAEYDEAISLFATVKKKRNAYAHGLWYTHESSRVWLAEASSDELFFFDKREVKIGELTATLQEMADLWHKLSAILR